MKKHTHSLLLLFVILFIQPNLKAENTAYDNQTTEQCWAFGRVWDYSSLEGYHYIVRPETMVPNITANLEDWITIKSVDSDFALRHMMLIKFGYRALGPKDLYGFLPVEITCIEEVKDTCGVEISYRPVGEYSLPVSNPQLIPYYINPVYQFGTQITNYQWDFGGSGKNIYHPEIHYFVGENVYNVCVTATHEGGCISHACEIVDAKLYPASKCDSLSYFDQENDTINCISAFGFTVSDSLPTTYFFKDFSKGNIESWLWDFGDGTYSNEQNPSHTYLDTISNYDFSRIDSEVFNSNPDSIIENFVKSTTHLVSLTVTNKKHHSSKLTKEIYESNTCWFREPNIFSVDSIAPFSYRFESMSHDDDNGELNKWDFGDGTGGVGCCPEHTYNSKGNYVVHLTNYFEKLGYEYSYFLKVEDRNFSGISDFESTGTVNLFPNPVVDIFNLEGLETNGANIVVFSADGKMRKVMDANGNNQWNIKDMPAGVYIISIIKGNSIIKKKLIKTD